MIGVFGWFSLSSCVIFFLLAAIVYFFNRRVMLNRIFIFAMLFGGYSLFTSFMVLQAGSVETAYFWNKVGFLWPFFVTLLVHFALVFTENGLINDKRIYGFLYLPATAFSLLDLTTNQLAGPPIKEYWGFVVPGSGSWLGAVCNIWSATLSLFALLICIRYYFRLNDVVKKKQAGIVTAGLAYPLIVAIFVQIASFMLRLVIPNNGTGSNAILGVFVVYAIWKYGLFNLNPSVAAENIITAMPDSFVLADLDGKIFRVNQSLSNLLGYQENELNEKSIGVLCKHEEHGKLILAEIREKREVRNYETVCKTKLDSLKSVSLSGSVVKSKSGQDIGIACIIHDLTVRKMMEEKLVKAERFAAIGELAGMIGHDLRNPLTSIQGAAYYLKRKHSGEMDASGKEMLDTIERSVRYSNKIINDLLDYSREVHLEISECTPKSLLHESLSLIEMPSHIQLFDFTQSEPALMVDVEKVKRVFVNLIKNGVDAMPKAGRLEVSSTQQEGYVDIAFIDNGVGIPEDVKTKLFSPLFTTKAQGMGFGLAICKRIVDSHGGKISLESGIGEGTKITVSLPFHVKTQTPKAN